jgi:putative transposase
MSMTAILAKPLTLLALKRTKRTKGCGSRIATLTMVFKLGLEAQKHWRRLNGSALLQKVITGVQFIDGEELQEQVA